MRPAFGAIQLSGPSRPLLYYLCVPRKLTIFVAAVATFLMAASPLFELVDRWDNIPATGNDTALTLVVIGACIGLCFGMASLLVWLAGWVFSLVMRLSSEMALASQRHAHTLEYERLLFSPPLAALSLRI